MFRLSLSGMQRYAVALAIAGGLFFCLRLGYAATPAATPAGDSSAFLKQTQVLATKDHPRFLQRLALLNQEASRLTPGQQWYLRYSNAWEAAYEGDYAKSEALLNDIIRHSGNPYLADRASAQLLSQLGLTRRYTEAFELAAGLIARLPQIKDAEARFSVLLNLAQALGFAGQTELGGRYARMAMAAVPPGGNACYPAAVLVDVLFAGRQLKPGSPELQQALAACPVATEPLYHTSLMLTLADLYAHGEQPRKALELLDRLQAKVDANDYFTNKLNAWADRAWALAALGDDSSAREAALAVVGRGPAGDSGGWMRDAYEVLYRIEKRQGRTAAALAYYEKFAALDKVYLNDVNARAMAYETVQQHLLAQRLETEKLDRQNAMLRVQRALDAKKVENTRLYIALLAMALVFAGLWLVRLKRSQLRFKRMSRMDGLTNILNRQHFVDEAKRVLREMEARHVVACMVFLDLDHFKRINDEYGHAAGDEVLRFVVAAARAQLRACDQFGRLGGEEFGILLAGCTRAQAADIADRIRRAIESTSVDYNGTAIAVSTSAGLAFTDTHGYQLQALFREADMALYKAKRGGRNRVFVETVDSGLSGL